jgi:hypothetical protein
MPPTNFFIKIPELVQTLILLTITHTKDKVVPVFNYESCNEDIRGSAGIAPPFLSSALHGGEWSVSRPECFTPWKSWYPLIGGSVKPRAFLNL